jgi:D-tagatose-1,6-bisphosphate aldolase subunit GatZ/KbaZ
MSFLQTIISESKVGYPAGVYSCCTSNSDVIRAVLLRARDTETPVLIESTSNQVNQFGGYSGLRPDEFFAMVKGIAEDISMDIGLVTIGGDHLGPLPWSDLSEEEAMRHAEELIRSCVKAGYSKIHLDTSMKLASDPANTPLTVEVCARRGARLCAAAEKASELFRHNHPGADVPVYVIGSEVPVPGGCVSLEEGIITKPESARTTIEAYRIAFHAVGLDEAFRRVIALVVDLGIEFHEFSISEYNRVRCADLVATMRGTPLCIEGHSTDFQTRQNLAYMCEDGVAILKVGPALTFALREAYFALEQIERELYYDTPEVCSNYRMVLEQVMLDNPNSWIEYYQGPPSKQRIARAYSFYDRCRYYLAQHEVLTARERLLENLSGNRIPLSLLSQVLPVQYYRIRSGIIRNEPLDIVMDHIGERIDAYLSATNLMLTMSRLTGKLQEKYE